MPLHFRENRLSSCLFDEHGRVNGRQHLTFESDIDHGAATAITRPVAAKVTAWLSSWLSQIDTSRSPRRIPELLQDNGERRAEAEPEQMLLASRMLCPLRSGKSTSELTGINPVCARPSTLDSIKNTRSAVEMTKTVLIPMRLPAAESPRRSMRTTR